MQRQLVANLKRLNLAQRFMLASLVILVGGMIGLGEWVGQQIELGVIHRTAATTALFVDSFIAPDLQELAQSDRLSPDHVASLNRLLQDTPLGQQIASFKVWGEDGQVLYSTAPSTIGQIFPMKPGLAQAWEGKVSSELSELEDAENVLERQSASRLLETYSPVRLGGTDEIIAVAEFYQTAGDLSREIAAARRRSWLIVGLAMLVMYLLLAGFVGRASDTIERQQGTLSRQVDQLTELLAQNASLHDRVRRAAARATALNERFLRRVSAELHDGPVQDIGLAMLRLDVASERLMAGDRAATADYNAGTDLYAIQDALQRALREIRALSAGLGVPHLQNLTLPEAILRAVRTHEQRSATKVKLSLADIPDSAPLSVKITAYRVIQEALNNAYRHAGGLGQQVSVDCSDGELRIEVADQGPGFPSEPAEGWDRHLGLAGMRERVESLGGRFQASSVAGQGARISAILPMQEVEASHA